MPKKKPNQPASMSDRLDAAIKASSSMGSLLENALPLLMGSVSDAAAIATLPAASRKMFAAQLAEIAIDVAFRDLPRHRVKAKGLGNKVEALQAAIDGIRTLSDSGLAGPALRAAAAKHALAGMLAMMGASASDAPPRT